MNVSLKNNDAVSGILKVEIEKNDYAELIDKNLHKLRQKVDMPGFRKGMVPFSIVKKLYGKHAMAEEVNKLVLEKLSSYIFDHDLKILGEPIPNETEQQTIDYDTDENFEFCFDVAFSPDVTVNLTKEDTLNYYQVRIDEAMINAQVNTYLNSYGTYDKSEKVETESLVKGIVTELGDDGEPAADGLLIEEALLMPFYIKDKEEQEKFIGASPEHKIVFNPHKAYEGAEAEIASFLQIDREKAKEIKGDFTFEIKEITCYRPAEPNREFFDRIFGPDVVGDEAAFREKIKDALAEQFASDSDYIFKLDIRYLLLKKAGKVTFAEDILKRCLLFVDKDNITKENVDEKYPKVAEDLTYHLAKEKLVGEYGIKVGEGDIKACGKRTAQAQYAQYYGLLSVPDNILEDHVKELLQQKDTVKALVNVVINEKLSALIKDLITVTVREVTAEELSEISKEHKNKNL
jgi:trigger factor